jgi:hypothetical protein
MGIFEEAGDIFYLEFSEIKDWIRSGANVSFRDIIQERRNGWRPIELALSLL